MKEILKLKQSYRNQMSKQEKEIFDGSTNFQKTQYLISAQQAWNYSETYYKESFYNGNGGLHSANLWILE